MVTEVIVKTYCYATLEPRPLLEHTVPAAGAKVIVDIGLYFCNNGSQVICGPVCSIRHNLATFLINCHGTSIICLMYNLVAREK
jgi:hypothetical protein